MLIDTHAHLCHPQFAADRDEVLDRAGRRGVVAVVAVGETVEDAELNLELSAADARLRPAVGLYPTVLDLDQAERLEEILRERRDEIYAVGEIGLDHWKMREPEELELQESLFRRFVGLARELDLPVNVHSRSAGRRTLEVLAEEGATKVQMHAFDGRAAKARPGVDAGYFFSVPPSIARSRQKQKLVAQLPLDCLLLETDSPVLGAVQGERNEPAEVTVSLEAIAEIQHREVSEVEDAVLANTVRLYGERILPIAPAAAPVPESAATTHD